MGIREGRATVKGVGRGSPRTEVVTVVPGTVDLETVLWNVLKFWSGGGQGLAELEGRGALGV